MASQSTMDKLHDMRLSVMARAYRDQEELPAASGLSFDERLAMIVDAEWDSRRTNKRLRHLRQAGFPEQDANIADVRYDDDRKLDRAQMVELSNCSWIASRRNIIVTGASGQKNAAAEQAGYPKGCIPIMPVADHEAVGGAREAVVDADVWKYAAEGKPLLAESLGAMERASEEGALLDVGSHVPITNGLSLAVASEFGAARVWLSPELTLRQIEEVAKDAPVELGVLLIGAQELMVTEHCMLMSQGPCDENCAECPRRKRPHVLKDRKGYEFPVVTDAMGRSHLYNAVELDIASSMPELLAAGISSYMVDATLMNAEETAHSVGHREDAQHHLRPPLPRRLVAGNCLPREFPPLSAKTALGLWCKTWITYSKSEKPLVKQLQ